MMETTWRLNMFTFRFYLKGARPLQPPNTSDIQEKENIMMLN